MKVRLLARFDHDSAYGPRRRWFPALLVMVIAALLLAACSDDSSAPEDRKFANDPADAETRATETPTLAPEPTEAGTGGQTQPEPSPAAVLDTRGAPDAFFVFEPENLSAVTLHGDRVEVTTWGAADGTTFQAIDDSPNASQVAALVNVGNTRLDLALYDRQGTEVLAIEDILDLRRMLATPISDGTGGATIGSASAFVAWSPLGDQILVGSSDGQLRSVPASGGEPVTFAADIDLAGLEGARWSPLGNQIAALVRDQQNIGRLYTLTVDGENLSGTSLVDVERLNEGNSVEHFAWGADGRSMLYVIADRQGADTVEGQLFTVNLESGQSTLLLTSGRGGPSGTIASITPSPDGRSVAAVIAVQEEGRLRFHTLVTRSLRTGETYEVQVTSLSDVPTVYWVDAGLAWNLPGRDGVDIELASPDGSVVELLPHDPNATPAASPVATPALRG